MAPQTYRNYLNVLVEQGFDQDIFMALRKAFNEHYLQMLRHFNEIQDTPQQALAYQRLLQDVKNKLDRIAKEAIDDQIDSEKAAQEMQALKDDFEKLRLLTALFVKAPDEGIANIAQKIVNSGRLHNG